jgi:hypothetical protein
MAKPKKTTAADQQLEDRITHLLSEWLNDNAPLGEERYRLPAQAAIKEVRAELEGRLKRITTACKQVPATLRQSADLLEEQDGDIDGECADVRVMADKLEAALKA